MTKSIILVLEDQLEEQITVLENIYGKYDKETLVDNDLSNYFQFPSLKREVYTEEVPKGDGTMTTKIK